MAGTKIGGMKAAAKNKARYGEDYYKNMGRLGGSVKGTKGGFAADIPCKCSLIDREHFVKHCAGKTGGTRSRRKTVTK